MVTAQKFKREAPCAVGDQINAEVVGEALFEVEPGQDAEEDQQEACLVKLGGMHRVGKLGELYGKNAVPGYAVAAACKKATNAAKGVGNGDTAGQKAKDVGQVAALTPALTQQINKQEGEGTADQAAKKGCK